MRPVSVFGGAAVSSPLNGIHHGDQRPNAKSSRLGGTKRPGVEAACRAPTTFVWGADDPAIGSTAAKRCG